MTTHTQVTEGFSSENSTHYQVTDGFETSVPWITTMLETLEKTNISFTVATLLTQLEKTSVTDCMWQDGVWKGGIWTHGPLDRLISKLET